MGKFLEGLADQLILTVRTVAWWHTAPRAPTKKGKAADDEPESRLDAERIRRRDRHWLPPDPCYVDAPHLLRYFGEVGPALPGPEPLTHVEIAAWSDLTGVELSPWEVRLLRRMSRAHCAEIRRAADPAAPSPSQRELSDEDRARVSQAVSTGLRSLFRRD